ncbi:MAG: porphobilinogen synthase, partial [Bacteroidetes bacterium]
MLTRPRRNRASQTIRDMLRETLLPASALIYPIFVLP